MKWRSIRTGRQQYPMSAAGKLAATTFPLILVFWALAYSGKVDATGYMIGIPLTIIAIAIEVSDVRRAKKSTRADSVRNGMRKTVPPKPKSHRVVHLLILGFGALLVVEALIHCFAVVRGISTREIPFVNAILIGLPALFLWIPIGMLLSNLILVATAYLGQTTEQRFAAARHFYEAQRDILKAAGYIAIICLPLIVLGFLL